MRQKILNPFFIILFTVFFLPYTSKLKAAEKDDYIFYHKQVMLAEEFIAEEQFEDALSIYDELFSSYDFTFLRDYQVASQLALHLGQKEKALTYVREGILTGWEMKSINRNDFLAPLREGQAWKVLEAEYSSLREKYESSLDSKLQERVKKMYSQDQKKALKALFKLSSKSQDRYAENKFAPHSEMQMEELINILNTRGYPGEKLIGNDYWMSTILSHHNSISQNYAKQDTLYPGLQPKLMQALQKGEVSPYELALIDEWRRSTLREDPRIGYAILNPPAHGMAAHSNELRKSVYLRSIEAHNSLLDIQEKSGMDFYLPDGWIKGKIEIKPELD